MVLALLNQRFPCNELLRGTAFSCELVISIMTALLFHQPHNVFHISPVKGSILKPLRCVIFTQRKMFTGISASTQKRSPTSLHPHKIKQDGGERLAFSLLDDNTPVLDAIYSGTWLRPEECTLWADVKPNHVTQAYMKTASWLELDFLFLTFRKFT